MPRRELYIGNLNRDVNQRDIERVFDRYGRLLRCDLKDRGFAFLEFEDERDAEDALRAENGKDMCGNSMVVEFAKNKDRGRFGGRDRGAPRSLECFECGERGHFARECRQRRNGYRRDDRGRGGYRDRSRTRSRSRDRRRSRDRSDRRSRDRSRDRSRERSYRERDSRERGGSVSKSRSRSPGYDRHRSKSYESNRS